MTDPVDSATVSLMMAKADAKFSALERVAEGLALALEDAKRELWHCAQQLAAGGPKRPGRDGDSVSAALSSSASALSSYHHLKEGVGGGEGGTEEQDGGQAPPSEGEVIVDGVNMGASKAAADELAKRAAVWRNYRQPVMGTAAQLKKAEGLEREALFRLGNAALHWLWHRENAPHQPSQGEGT